MASFKVFVALALAVTVLACFEVVEASAAKDQAESNMMAFLGALSGKRGKPTKPIRTTTDDLLCYGSDTCLNVWCRQSGGECVGTGGTDCACVF